MQSDHYVDGFLLAVPGAQKERYLQVASKAARLFKEHGALGVVECWGDDVPDGKLTSMPMAVRLKPGETVVFSWITWPSRQVRDTGMKAFMEDPRCPKDMPFDGKRLIYGHSLGGAVAIDLAAELGKQVPLPVRGLVIESTFTSLADVATAVANTSLPVRWLLSQKFDSIDKIADIHMPLLVVHGLDDRYVPPRFSQSEILRVSPL